uniref:site-specific DNA-methyltransferase n=1 Tax=Levilinea saccharolytica TaxID=229921 RepID=UPI001F420DFD|nr:DNA methyltransferase [Levilinea saccharolytica]
MSTRKRDVKDGKEEDLTRQPEQIKAFRDTWELGIHSYLSYLRDRFVVVRELLTESGSFFVQINSENSHLVTSILDEVFGSENFIANIIFRKKSLPLGAKHLETMHDHILFYAKNKDQLKYRQLYEENDVSQITSHGPYALFPDGSYTKIDVTDFQSPLHPKNTYYYRLFSTIAPSYSPQTDFEFEFEGNKYNPPSRGAWVVDRPKLERIVQSNRLQVEGKSLSYRLFFDDFPYKKITNFWLATAMSYAKIYVVQTTPDIISRCLLMTTDPGDLVLDPTCGSGTTAYAAEQWGRRWITIDTSRVAVALARTRLMAGRYPYYLLADSPEGQRKERELDPHPQPFYPAGTMSLGEKGAEPSPAGRGQGEGDIRRGFVYKRVPHITLKSIANNEEIDTIHEKWQAELEPLREKLNQALGQHWEDWQIPREAPLTPSLSQGEREPLTPPLSQGEREPLTPPLSQGEREKVVELLAEWWALRRQRQQEMDASIARRADTELLYDQPYEDNKRVRVTGPFTVESLSPHRVLSTDEERPRTEQEGQNQAAASGGFETLILDNLRAAGVENTKKGERLRFTRLEPYAGTWLHAVGEYEEASPHPNPLPKGEGTAPSPQPSPTGRGSDGSPQPSPTGRGSDGSPQPSPTGRGSDGSPRPSSKGEGVVRRVAVCIGPEHGTVSPDLIKDAAKEAVQGVGFDLLVVLGFAFDPHVSEEIHRYGKLTVLPARINPDLQMGNLLLKKSGVGNLFMVFGEPDVEVKELPDGKLTVTIQGVDIYDPTTGEIRSSSTDDIACWFIDTDYNGESFFVRHAYFTGADQPYEKLKRALRAEVDEAAWSALYATTSYPFEKPRTGKIAVKVINHYGDEVLKVYAV